MHDTGNKTTPTGLCCVYVIGTRAVYNVSDHSHTYYLLTISENARVQVWICSLEYFRDVVAVVRREDVKVRSQTSARRGFK